MWRFWPRGDVAELAARARALGAAIPGTAATITTSMREIDRVKTVQALVDRMLPVRLAARAARA